MSVRTLPSPLSLEDFELGVTLGTGSFGRVRFCTHKVTSIIYAVEHGDLVNATDLFFVFLEYGFILGVKNVKEVRSHQAPAGR